MTRKSFGEQIAAAQRQADDEPHVALPKVLARPPGDGRKPASDRKRPRYPSEEHRRKATYDLDRELIEAIRRIAAEEYLERGQSRVAQALLVYAVAQYDAGRLALERRSDGADWWLEAVEAEAP
jgi:hypothetical protein